MIFLFVALLGFAQAETETVRIEKTYQRVNVDLFTEISSFNRNGEQLQGEGLGTSIRYAFSNKLALGLVGSQAMTLSGGISALYTEIRSFVSYPLIGNFATEENRVFVDDRTAYLSREVRQHILSISLGVDEYLFNGTTSVNPASGLDLGIRYDFFLIGVNWLAALQTPYLTLNGKNLSGFEGLLGITFPF